jgi:hypothetical protein
MAGWGVIWLLCPFPLAGISCLLRKKFGGAVVLLPIWKSRSEKFNDLEID